MNASSGWFKAWPPPQSPAFRTRDRDGLQPARPIDAIEHSYALPVNRGPASQHGTGGEERDGVVDSGNRIARVIAPQPDNTSVWVLPVLMGEGSPTDPVVKSGRGSHRLGEIHGKTIANLEFETQPQLVPLWIERGVVRAVGGTFGTRHAAQNVPNVPLSARRVSR